MPKSRTISFGLVFLVSLFALAWLPQSVSAEDPVSIVEWSSKVVMQEGGGKLIEFTAVVKIAVVPLVFNYHWERSDGAKGEQKMETINDAGTRTVRLVETWQLGPGAPVRDVWERVYVNTGNTHIKSVAIPARLTEP